MNKQNKASKKGARTFAAGGALLCLALAATAMPVMALANGETLNSALAAKNITAVAEGTLSANENAHWALGSNGALAVKGTGATAADSDLYDIGDQVKHLFIGKEIDAIGNESFSYFTNLESIEFESGSRLSSIDSYAFAGCRSLKHVTLPNSVNSIGEAAFLDCEKLKKVDLGKDSTLRTLGPSAFINCKKLEGIELPKTLESIGDYAFNGCTNLPTIIIPSNVKTVGEEAFGDCNKLKDITVEDPSKTSIDNYAFAGQTATKPATVAIKSIKTGKRTAKVTWTKVKGCKKYRLFYKQESAKKFKNKTVKAASTVTVKKLKSGKRYQFYVVAQKGGKCLCKSMVRTSGKVK